MESLTTPSQQARAKTRMQEERENPTRNMQPKKGLETQLELHRLFIHQDDEEMGEDMDDSSFSKIHSVVIHEQKYAIQLVQDDGSIPGSLFAFHVWNGAKCLASYIAEHPEVVQHQSVVEVGAASALPSLASLVHGANCVVLTDYPCDLLLENMRQNVILNQALYPHRLLDTSVFVKAHRWGDSVEEVRRCLLQSFTSTWSSSLSSTQRLSEEKQSKLEQPLAKQSGNMNQHEDQEKDEKRRENIEEDDPGNEESGGKKEEEEGNSSYFDLALVGECLWLHNQHENLLQSLRNLLRPGGKALVSFSHHVPGCEQADVAFFAKAKMKEHGGFLVKHLMTTRVPEIFSPTKETPHFLYQLTKPSNGHGEKAGFRQAP